MLGIYQSIAWDSGVLLKMRWALGMWYKWVWDAKSITEEEEEEGVPSPADYGIWGNTVSFPGGVRAHFNNLNLHYLPRPTAFLNSNNCSNKWWEFRPLLQPLHVAASSRRTPTVGSSTPTLQTSQLHSTATRFCLHITVNTPQIYLPKSTQSINEIIWKLSAFSALLPTFYNLHVNSVP